MTTRSDDRLAIDGGTPVRQDPFPPWPVYGDEAKKAVIEVLDSGKTNYWAGPKGRQFQNEFAAYCGVKHAIAVNSGTSALHVALAAAEVGPGDEVIVPATTFIASATSVLNQNAVPVFADIDPRTHNVTAETIGACITPCTRAVTVVHFAGHPCDMDPIMALAEKHDLVVIEDAAQAHGAEYKGRKAGALGHIAAFSFCAEKIISTGEGGMVTTSDERMAGIASSFRDHGFDEEERWRLKKEGAQNLYFHYRMGFNYRLTEMQSAMGLAALRELEANLAQRRRNAERLARLLSDMPAITPAYESPDVKHAYYVYPAQVDAGQLRVDRDAFVKAVRAEGIPIGLGNSPENYLEEVFTQMVGYGRTTCPFTCPMYDGRVDYAVVHCPNAAAYGERCFRLKVHPTASAEDMDDTVRAIEKVLRAYAK